MNGPEPTRGIRGWLQLVRPPNLFSVPGDVLVGAAAVGAFSAPGQLIALSLGSIALYAFGLVLNDLVDRREDAAERPNRPLPSGAVSVSGAMGLAAVCALAGTGLAAAVSPRTALAAVVVVSLVCCYNVTKRILVWGEVCMGSCRTANVLLGACLIAGWGQALGPALALGAYIFLVAWIARHETTRTPHPHEVAALAAIPIVLPFCSGNLDALAWAIYAVFVIRHVQACTRLASLQDAAGVPPLIGLLIRNYILLQASFVAAFGQPVVAFVLCACIPVAGWVARRFYGS